MDEHIGTLQHTDRGVTMARIFIRGGVVSPISTETLRRILREAASAEREQQLGNVVLHCGITDLPPAGHRTADDDP